MSAILCYLDFSPQFFSISTFRASIAKTSRTAFASIIKYSCCTMGQAITEGGNTGQLTMARALEIIRNNEEGQVHPSVTVVLERAIGDIWRKIQAQPTSYVMSKDEFAVFNYYRNRFKDYQVAQQAVARFWNHYKGSASHANGSKSP